ncbi:MAG: hypothetical protein DIZ78_08185 [endosymbiont of Escarpia spicata]|uniref:Tetratricopeptide repeat-containing protein n=1 Tax=endosymbiont of Escarpia spicata TaxID=2200908 RepID=A0A370DQN3_9GAMM|nr:MAG: hypothetical protein DIZ78_08185 [endosymbiont of Escarpia spicata]
MRNGVASQTLLEDLQQLDAHKIHIAHWLGQSGQVETALEQFNTLLTEQVRILGVDHPDTLITRNNMAYLLAQSGFVEASLKQFNTLLTDQVHILGEKHPDTINILQAIDYLNGRLAGSNDQEDGHK